jgi:hypothetical protein
VTRRVIWPVAVMASGVATLALFAALYRADRSLYLAVLTGWGLEPFHFPFLDTHAILSALECSRRGFDVYRDNPCDVLARAFVYSPMILDASFLKVTPRWLDWTGLGLAAAYFLGLSSLPSPRGAREWIVMSLAICSTMSVYALERGNIDLLMFVLVVAAGHLMQRGRAARAAGYGLILFSAGLKYYPLAALALAVRERPRRLVGTLAACAGIVALFAWRYRQILPEAIAHVPQPSYTPDLFGALNLPRGLMILLKVSGTPPEIAAVTALLPWIVLALLIYLGARRAIAVSGEAGAFARLDATRASLLAAGAAIIVGCFAVEQNVGYRGIYFLAILPGLLAMARMPGAPGRLLFTAYLILFLMWSEIVPMGLQQFWRAYPDAKEALYVVRIAFWLLRELVWWQVIGTLLGLLMCFALNSPIGEVLRHRSNLKAQVEL